MNVYISYYREQAKGPMKTTSAALLLLGAVAGSTSTAFFVPSLPTAAGPAHHRGRLTTRMHAEVYE